MYFNLLDIPTINQNTRQQTIDVFNTLPYLIHAVDVYITAEKTSKYNWIMSPSNITDPNTGIVSSVAKLSIDIDGTIFPLKAGSVGESATNPITFVRANYTTQLDNNGFIGMKSDHGFNSTNLDGNIGDRVVGTNIVNSDSVQTKIIVNDISLIAGRKFPFGGASDSSIDGFGGSKIVDSVLIAVEGFGGVENGLSLEGITLVIQPSQFLDDLNNRDYGIGVQNYGIRY